MHASTGRSWPSAQQAAEPEPRQGKADRPSPVPLACGELEVWSAETVGEYVSSALQKLSGLRLVDVDSQHA